MKLFALLALACVLSGCANVQPFDSKDRARMTAVYASIAADALTTNRIRSTPGLHENGPLTRPLLGPQPSAAGVAAYAVAEAFIARVVLRRMGPKARKISQYFLIADHSVLGVVNNCRDGLC